MSLQREPAEMWSVREYAHFRLLYVVSCNVYIVEIVRTVGGQFYYMNQRAVREVKEWAQYVNSLCNSFCNLMEISGKGKRINFPNCSYKVFKFAELILTSTLCFEPSRAVSGWTEVTAPAGHWTCWVLHRWSAAAQRAAVTSGDQTAAADPDTQPARHTLANIFCWR